MREVYVVDAEAKDQEGRANDVGHSQEESEAKASCRLHDCTRDVDVLARSSVGSMCTFCRPGFRCGEVCMHSAKQKIDLIVLTGGAIANKRKQA